MNKNFDSSLENAMSVLNKAKNFGMRVRFVFAHDTFGNFGLDGMIEELEQERWLFRGTDCNALVDWGTCKLIELEDMRPADSSFSFLFFGISNSEERISLALQDLNPSLRSRVD